MNSRLTRAGVVSAMAVSAVVAVTSFGAPGGAQADATTSIANRGFDEAPAVSHDGRMIVFASSPNADGTDASLFLRDRGALEPDGAVSPATTTAISDSLGAVNPAISGNGCIITWSISAVDDDPEPEPQPASADETANEVSNDEAAPTTETPSDVVEPAEANTAADAEPEPAVNTTGAEVSSLQLAPARIVVLDRCGTPAGRRVDLLLNEDDRSFGPAATSVDGSVLAVTQRHRGRPLRSCRRWNVCGNGSFRRARHCGNGSSRLRSCRRVGRWFRRGVLRWARPLRHVTDDGLRSRRRERAGVDRPGADVGDLSDRVGRRSVRRRVHWPGRFERDARRPHRQSARTGRPRPWAPPRDQRGRQPRRDRRRRQPRGRVPHRAGRRTVRHHTANPALGNDHSDPVRPRHRSSRHDRRQRSRRRRRQSACRHRHRRHAAPGGRVVRCGEVRPRCRRRRGRADVDGHLLEPRPLQRRGREPRSGWHVRDHRGSLWSGAPSRHDLCRRRVVHGRTARGRVRRRHAHTDVDRRRCVHHRGHHARRSASGRDAGDHRHDDASNRRFHDRFHNRSYLDRWHHTRNDHARHHDTRVHDSRDHDSWHLVDREHPDDHDDDHDDRRSWRRRGRQPAGLRLRSHDHRRRSPHRTRRDRQQRHRQCDDRRSSPRPGRGWTLPGRRDHVCGRIGRSGRTLCGDDLVRSDRDGCAERVTGRFDPGRRRHHGRGLRHGARRLRRSR